MEQERMCANCAFWNEVDNSNVGPCGCQDRTEKLGMLELPSITGGDYCCDAGWHRFLHEVLQYAGDMDGMLFPKLEGDVGYDLVVSETTSIEPHSFANVPHKVAVKLPKGFWGIILARSGTNIAGKLIVLPGVIDTGYTGRLFALLHNVSNETIKIKKGTRVCQLILIQAQLFPMLFVSALPSTERGDGGFGSTGGTNGKVKNPNHEE